MIHVDIVGAERLETLLQTFDYFCFRVGMIRRGQGFFCRYHQPLAGNSRERFADDRFGPIVLRGIEKINAEIESLFDERDGTMSRLRVIAHSEAARAAAAKPGNADLQGSPP